MSTPEITRRQFITGTAAALTLPFISLDRASAADRPNFVFILIDDLRYDALSCLGNPVYRTPNIDRIRNEGANFSNAFVTTSLCSPSRASFLTGQYVHTHGIRDNKTPLSDAIPTFPQVLQKAGYDTAFMGKWHQGQQEGVRPGFNRWVSFKGQGVYTDCPLNVDGQPVKSTGYTTDVLTKYAVDWLKQPRSKPFCLYLSHKAVHGPLNPALRHERLYENDTFAEPANAGIGKGEPAWLNEVRPTQHGWPGKNPQEFRRRYGRVLAAVDDSVKQVLSTLESQGQLDNTVVIFAGDNGYYLGEHGLVDKRSMHEESIRIPFIMRYPKMLKPGTVIDEMFLNIDLCPTLIDLAGAQVPQGVQGVSAKPLMAGKKPAWREDWYYEYDRENPYLTPTVRGVRTKRWKYVEYPDINDTAELYDLKSDPGEMNNLISDPKHASVLADMKKRLARLKEETGAEK